MAWLLDTNILSEIRKGARCERRVRLWYDGIEEEDFFLSVLVLGEISWGIENLQEKDVPRAKALERWMRQVEVVFDARILPVTMEIAHLWGRLCPRQRLPAVDGLQAATALHHGLTFVTHNKRDVLRSGVDCFDPFVD